MSKRTKDFFYKQAKEVGAVARSFFKIEDLDKKYRLVKPKMRIMDVGAAPGSWIQYLLQKTGEEGFIYAVDLNPLNISVPENVVFDQKNLFDIPPEEIKNTHGMFDLIISDVAPRTTGSDFVDQTKSYNLVEHVRQIAILVLKKNCNMICKMYQSGDTKKFTEDMKEVFSEVKIQKPESSRKQSREIFIIGLNKK
ncbi:MAG: RlmE family RNA methyltransferase [Proteobacteria bacterium]|jgi:23S rRNA (uridine2552-2'-O)-methyltransferase|nr:RlmE family RNA methyltransferase [Pseudomonadota bacterium]